MKSFILPIVFVFLLHQLIVELNAQGYGSGGGVGYGGK
jgi:hypothetical protein